jgi:hypothetical protein
LTDSTLFRLCSNVKGALAMQSGHAKVAGLPGSHAGEVLASECGRTYFSALPANTTFSDIAARRYQAHRAMD